MVQYIKQGDIFGRIGTGVGKGLAEQLPKSFERGRLSGALKNIGEQKDQTPWGRFTALASQASDYPQIVQSGERILNQQGMLQGARDRQPTNQPEQPQQSQFDAVRNNQRTSQNNNGSGLVGTENTKAALQPAIPKSLRELQDRAVELNKESPGLYPDFPTAMSGAQSEDQQRVAQNQAQQNARSVQKGVQSDIRNEIANLKAQAKVKVPDNVYQKIENKAIDEVANGKDELKAAKDARDELDKISRDYSKIDSFGDYTLLGSNPKEVRTSIDSLRKKFAENNDSENFADALVGRNGLSNEYAHYLAMPPRKEFETLMQRNVDMKSPALIKKLASMLTKDDSPLAIGHLLSENEKDSNAWRQYLLDNQNDLKLSVNQVRELEKVDSIGQGYLNDLWLKAFGGK